MHDTIKLLAILAGGICLGILLRHLRKWMLAVTTCPAVPEVQDTSSCTGQGSAAYTGPEAPGLVEKYRRKFQRNLVGRWSDCWEFTCPFPAWYWEFYPNGSGKIIYAFKGEPDIPFEWQELSERTIRFRTPGPQVEGGTAPERGRDTEQAPGPLSPESPPWEIIAYDFAVIEDYGRPCVVLRGRELEPSPLPYALGEIYFAGDFSGNAEGLDDSPAVPS